MKTLLIVRHAKSSWADPTLADHDRPLAPRGVRAGKRVADYLLSQRPRPELVLCSTARRAQDTLALLRPALGEASVHVEDWLYLADADRILASVGSVDAGVNCSMIIGHNPALHELLLVLVRSGDEGALAQLRTNFPTAAVAVVTAEVDTWAELAARGGRLDQLALPRQLPKTEQRGSRSSPRSQE